MSFKIRGLKVHAALSCESLRLMAACDSCRNRLGLGCSGHIAARCTHMQFEGKDYDVMRGLSRWKYYPLVLQ